MRSKFSDYELQWRLIYSVIVAGKSASFTDAVMKRLLPPCDKLPFDVLREWINLDKLSRNLRANRTGNYAKLQKCIQELLARNFDLGTVNPEQLEQIHGIGPKTSRFFVLWTRPWERFAALDVHVLRWLRTMKRITPLSTPSGKEYARLESVFLAQADQLGMTPRELDFKIWKEGSGYTGDIQEEET